MTNVRTRSVRCERTGTQAIFLEGPHPNGSPPSPEQVDLPFRRDISVTITESTRSFTPRLRLNRSTDLGDAMSEDRVPLLKDRTVSTDTAPSRVRPDIVIRMPHLEIPVDPKPSPRP